MFRMINKRIRYTVAAACVAASMLTGCGSTSGASSDESSTEGTTEAAEARVYSADAYLTGITASEYVTLPDYAEIPVEMTDPRENITDDYVETYIQGNLTNDQELVEVTDRAVQDGDVVNIDYVGKMDGVAFDGGTAEGYDLTIGSNRFIDDFEEQLIGWEIGDSNTIEVTFPDPYDNNPDYAGKDATFDVTINGIQEYQTPAFTDAWVAEQGIDGVATTEEYTTYIREYLLERAQETYDSNLIYYAGQYLVDHGTWIQEPPTEMVDRWYDSNLSYYENYASAYGVELSEFLSYVGYDADNYETQIRENAEDTARLYICLQAVADAEDLNLTDAEYKTQIATLAAQQGYTDSDTFEDTYGEDYIREYLLVTRVEDYLKDKAVVTAPAVAATDEAGTAEEADATTGDAATDVATVVTTEDAAAEADTENAAE